jgi:glucose/arabinose dehydrogenase
MMAPSRLRGLAMTRASCAALLALGLGACGGGSDTMPGNGAAPMVTLQSPANFSAALTGTLTLSAAASDDVAVAAVEFQVDGQRIGAEDTAAPYGATLDTGAYAPGQHILRARARDDAGNLSSWSAVTVSFAGSQTIGAGFTKEEDWVGGLNNATAFAQAPDGRLFVCEQGGTLRVVKNGVLLSTPFHRFTDTNASGERGLLGVALHPSFASNGWVYVYRTTTQNGTHNRISRLVANGDVSNGGEDALVDLPLLSSATNHNGGGIHFGPDGKLYAGVGENANAANAQNLGTPLGKLLRFNDDGSVPIDNPFVATQTGLAQAIWAYGLRNPYTFAFQPGTGRLYINDVGADTWEEIDAGSAGANYGWPMSEGPDDVKGNITGPLFAYKHSAASPPGSGTGGFFVGIAISGGAFYPSSGGSFPAAYEGNYFFADFGSGFIARLDSANGNAAYAFAQLSGNPVDLLVGSDGALYALKRGAIARISAN